MSTVSVELRNVGGTEAALDWTGAHFMPAAVVSGSIALNCWCSRSAVVSAMTFVTLPTQSVSS
jgi:hypothetical protein